VAVVGSEASSGGHAVDMGMMLQPLVPGMEHAEEADLRAEVAGILWLVSDDSFPVYSGTVAHRSFVL
jgi:hypothetical protein